MLQLANDAARPRARAREVRASLRNEDGAFDLPSIMVGVAVVAILTAGVLAAIFGVIPWSQDNQAKQSLGSVTTAQGTHYARGEGAAQGYATLNELQDAGYLADDIDPAKVMAVGDRDQWAAAVMSETGTAFCASDAAPSPNEVNGLNLAGALNECIDESNTAVSADATDPDGADGLLTEDATGGPAGDPSATPGPGPAPGGTPVVMTAGYDHTFVLDAGAVYGHGTNWGGQLGTGSAGADSSVATGTVDLTAFGGSAVAALESGYGATYAIDSAGRLFVWGVHDDSAYLGTGEAAWTERHSPVQIDVDGKTVKQVATGQYVVAVLATDGTVYTWGPDYDEVLGNGPGISAAALTPQQIGGAIAGRNIVQLAVSSAHAIALDDTGRVYEWGESVTNGAAMGSPVEVPLTGALAGKTIVQVATGGWHNLLLDSDGVVYAWGYNHYGAIGNGVSGGYASQPTPVQSDLAVVPAGNKIVRIHAFESNSMAMDDKGQLYMWGRGYYVGSSTTTNRSRPVLAADGFFSDKTVTGFDAGYGHVAVATDDGNVWTWGDSDYRSVNSRTPIDAAWWK